MCSSAKELNISFFKETEIKTKKSIDDLKNQVKHVVLEHLGSWEDQSHEFIKSFAGRFGAENMVVRCISSVYFFKLIDLVLQLGEVLE